MIKMSYLNMRLKTNNFIYYIFLNPLTIEIDKIITVILIAIAEIAIFIIGLENLL